LSVCFSVCPLAYLGNHTVKLHHFLHVTFGRIARSSSNGIEIRYVLPVLWMTSYCNISLMVSMARRVYLYLIHPKFVWALQLSFCCFFPVVLLFIFATSSVNKDEYVSIRAKTERNDVFDL